MLLFQLLALSLTVGCTGTGDPSWGSAVAPDPAESGPFMGLPDDRSRKVGDEYPESAVADLETMTKVRHTTYAVYQEMKKEGSITAEQRRGRYVYFAVTQIRHIPFPNGSSAYVKVVERYKALVPEKS